MTETNVSASHFRVHLKEIANSVHSGGQAVTVERHGLQMFAVVSLEDLEFLRKHKYGATKAPPPSEAAKPEPVSERLMLDDPDRMPIERVEEAYQLSNGTTDLKIIQWREQAYTKIRLVRGKPPDVSPEPAHWWGSS